LIIGSILFFLAGLFLSDIFMSFLCFFIGFAALITFFLRGRNFFELNEKGIVYSLGKKKIKISWENINKIGIEELRVGNGKIKFLGINLKDTKPIKESLGESWLESQKSYYNWDVTIFSTFDIERIERLILEYWKKPELRKELGES
ncbi:MAG: hypothetical protein QW412_02360, partial [Candidatus Aenigmatarchaeota archaeon]